MNEPLLSADVARLADLVGVQQDDVLRDMEDRARAEGFPTVGPHVGRWLAALVRMTGARRVYEFGSGFGYSAYWTARALDGDGEVVLTERDPGLLDRARQCFERGGLADRARFESGDAVAVLDDVQGDFDLALLDHEKDRYAEAFDAVRERIPPGGLVLADNVVTASQVDADDVVAAVEGGEPDDATAASLGVADYLRRVREDDAFETVLLPVGEGLSVSRRRA